MDHEYTYLGSGTILREIQAAAQLLIDDWNVASDVWSVTSFSELARDAREVERTHRLNPNSTAQSHVQQQLSGDAPIIAATDYVCAYPQLIAPYVAARFVALGTDGFGRSDTRAALRQFFEVSRQHIVIAALNALAQAGALDPAVHRAALQRHEIDTIASPPWQR